MAMLVSSYTDYFMFIAEHRVYEYVGYDVYILISLCILQ